MILDQSVFFQKGVQALMETLGGEEFRKRVENLGSYDFRSVGRILYCKTVEILPAMARRRVRIEI